MCTGVCSCEFMCWLRITAITDSLVRSELDNERIRFVSRYGLDTLTIRTPTHEMIR